MNEKSLNEIRAEGDPLWRILYSDTHQYINASLKRMIGRLKMPHETITHVYDVVQSKDHENNLFEVKLFLFLILFHYDKIEINTIINGYDPEKGVHGSSYEPHILQFVNTIKMHIVEDVLTKPFDVTNAMDIITDYANNYRIMYATGIYHKSPIH